MRLRRRDVLAGAVAMAAVPSFASPMPVLRAAAGTAQLAPPEYDPTPIWGYDAAVPGPEIRLAQGARLTRRLLNELPQPTSVHWHGIRIENAMDGVVGMTQEAVPPGGSFDYDFALPDAGTYWYHPHHRTWEQMARGLYGPLIVEEAQPPEVDEELVLMLDDWRFAADATLHDSFGAPHDWAHAGRIGNWVTVNGRPDWQHRVAQGARLRLRLINCANARIFPLALSGMRAHVVALDGQPVERPYAVSEVTLAPAQRCDLIVDVTAAAGGTARITERDREGELALADFPVEGVARSADLEPPAALPPNALPEIGALDGAQVAQMRMQGGAMGGMLSAELNGTRQDMRALAGQGAFWALEGVAMLAEAPFLRAALGETVRIALRNDTAWPHAMHLHGHHFRRVDSGTPGPWRDTLLLDRRESAEIAFVADNPGKWLFHCHMLEHAAGGMVTWIEVG
ncbi:Multicopper oxidase [Candidatus Rhodobacter oscarellae]|uniref:Multicopper oxidase n=1 Tax=Candidatus Rhodobacter oscarellae TaxID=1675527 RepID=A0A0J9E0Z3_9RHOB|nr:multicopper oxidase family protein [Candidatus Rhodobacter lobularis]KMW56347.1 Multicopper oxidase [Candidatus Rhodobacter lobularis]